MRTYVLDSDAWICLKTHYPRDVAPAVWEAIEDLIAEGTIISVHEVYRELLNGGGEDEIRVWAESHSDTFHEMCEVQIAILATELLVQFPKLANHDSQKPFADPWLVAMALKLIREGADCCVVTEEKLGGDGASKVPNVCRHYEVPCTNLVGMFRELKIKWG